jgi:hypothetical protein
MLLLHQSHHLLGRSLNHQFVVSGRRLTFDSPTTEPSLEQVSLALQQKLLASIQASIPKKRKRSKRVERHHHGLGITEATAREALVRQEKEKEEKLAKKNQPKTARPTKKRKTAATTTVTVDPNPSTSATTIESTSAPESESLISGKKCKKCKKNYDNAPDWRSCESEQVQRCANWICGACLPNRWKINPALEYFCSNKCRNPVNTN